MAERTDKNMSKLIAFRLSTEEYARLERKSQETGMTVSQVIRKNLSSRNPDRFEGSEGDRRADTIVSLKNFLANIEADYKSTMDTLKKALTLKNRGGQPAINDFQLARYMTDQTYALNEAKRVAGELMKELQKEPAETAPAQAGSLHNNDAKLSSVTSNFRGYISGKIASQLTDYERFGKRRVYFDVAVSEMSAGKKWNYTVRVDMLRTDAADALKRGVGVSVFGDLHVELDMNSGTPDLKIILTSNNLSIS